MLSLAVSQLDFSLFTLVQSGSDHCQFKSLSGLMMVIIECAFTVFCAVKMTWRLSDMSSLSRCGTLTAQVCWLSIKNQ